MHILCTNGNPDESVQKFRAKYLFLNSIISSRPFVKWMPSSILHTEEVVWLSASGFIGLKWATVTISQAWHEAKNLLSVSFTLTVLCQDSLYNDILQQISFSYWCHNKLAAQSEVDILHIHCKYLSSHPATKISFHGSFITSWNNLTQQWYIKGNMTSNVKIDNLGIDSLIFRKLYLWFLYEYMT